MLHEKLDAKLIIKISVGKIQQTSKLKAWIFYWHLVNIVMSVTYMNHLLSGNGISYTNNLNILSYGAKYQTNVFLRTQISNSRWIKIKCNILSKTENNGILGLDNLYGSVHHIYQQRVIHNVRSLKCLICTHVYIVYIVANP